MIRFNKHVLAATLLIAGASVQAEKDNSCYNIMSWVNGKFRMFSTECPDEMVSKPKKTKVKYEDNDVQQGGGWGLFNWNWNTGNNITISNGTVINNGSGCSTMSDSNSTTVSNKSIFNGGADKTIKLTGTKKRVPLNDAVDTVSVPSSLAHVTMSDINPYIECDEAVFGSDFELGVKRGRLQPNLKKNTSIRFKGTGGQPLCTVFARMLNDQLYVDNASKVKVDTSTTKYVTASGASSVSVDNAVTKLKSVNVTGASKISIPNLDTQTFDATLSGASDVIVQGTVDQQTVNVSGASSYKAHDLKSDVAKVNVSGASSARLWVNRILSGWVTGASSVRYRGNAEDNVHESGASSCKKSRF